MSELLVNNSDNREKLKKVSKTLGMTGFIGLFRVSCFRDTLTPFCHVFVTPKYLQKTKKPHQNWYGLNNII